ncbi:hypothetical protein JW916_16520 [Candidatus Sumerlaeota bacterium]|nr:hypothetical protein [Candidatus Sumerlaeota bacterium]
MGDTELRETIGMWDDSGVKKYPLNMVICVALALLIFPPLFMDPPLVGQVHYYKGEGRVYLKSGWFDLNDRVYRVVGDPSEDGYK